MHYEFRSTATSGKYKGEPMEAWKNKDGKYVLQHPSKRFAGKVYKDENTYTSSSGQAKRLLEENRCSIRMKVQGIKNHPGNMIQADRIEIIGIDT